ncbi:MAG: metallophosphoesterase [Cyanobacteriota bacterium]|nr:metallophosphoesterase [Cyanobacteriota bacterium]
MRLLQLSDPHLLADPAATYRGRRPEQRLRHALSHAQAQLAERGDHPDLLLISGDLCQDETWGGYCRLRAVLRDLAWPVALVSGNHDHPQLLRAALGRRALLGPARLRVGHGTLLLLESHCAGWCGGRLGALQLAWLERQLADLRGPAVVVVHHPPLPIGDPGMDAIGLADGPALMASLARQPAVRAVLTGHLHQHWQGVAAQRSHLMVWACPSTLCGFGPVQPCPLGRPADPGGRWLELTAGGEIRQRLLRWDPPSVG